MTTSWPQPQQQRCVGRCAGWQTGQDCRPQHRPRIQFWPCQA